jgi:hypothetical protein
MIPNWNTLSAAEEHRKDLLREAAEEQHAMRAVRLTRPRRRPFTRALGALGRRLVAWGSRLERLEAAIAE